MAGKRSKRSNGRNNNRKDVIVFRRGTKVKVPNHPTEITSQPWFNLVVRMNNPTNVVDSTTLYVAMTTQLQGLSFNSSLINIRLLSVHVWGPIPTTNTPLVCRFYDLFDEVAGSSPAGNMLLEEVTDYADQVNRARVGYRYSTAQQQKSLLITSSSNDRLLAVSGAGPGSVAYFYLMWRPFPQQLPPGYVIC